MGAKAAVRTVVLVLLTGLAVTGCWNRREIETLGFVMAAGLDEAVEEGKLQLTVQIAKPFAIGTAEGKGITHEKPFWIVSSTGYTVFEAVRSLLSQSPRRPFWGHCRFIIMGETLARRGVRRILDGFARDGETREHAWIMVAKGVKASDALQAEFELERLPSEGVMGVLLAARAGLSTTSERMLVGFLRALEGEGIDPVASRLEIVPRPQESDIRGELVREEVGGSLRMTGAAVFRRDRLVGWLNKPEARGFNWIMGEAEGGTIVIKNPGEEGTLVGLEVLRARGGFRTEAKEGGVSVKVKVEAEGNLGDAGGVIDPISSPGVWASMERRMATVIRNEVLAAVAKAQGLGADIFGFGAELYRSDPKNWAKLKDRWDEEFPRVSVQVDVRARLRHSGLTIRSIRIKR